MIAFATLLERLTLTPGRLAKLALLREFFRTEPDPDRGWGLAALTGTLSFPLAKPALIRALAQARTDPVLFEWSYDYVGDLAETVSLIWPARDDAFGRNSVRTPPMLAEVVDGLMHTPKAELPALLEGWLDASDPPVRYAILKLMTGALRVGASARLAKTALAELAGGSVSVDEIEEVWHGLAPPYAELFDWLDRDELLHGPPQSWVDDWEAADPDRF